MYSVLLVEDEKIELDTLKNYIDWKKIGIDKVFTARGSRSALECISGNEPDIVITDIQMPGMSGIELAQLIKEENHACKIIFLTGYDKFEYAKEAIRVNAEDYLLKPFQVEEVEQLVQKVRKKIEQERLSKEAGKLAVGKILEQACTGILSEPDAVSNSYFQKNVADVQFYMFALYGLNGEQQRFVNRLPEVIHGFFLESLYIVLIYPTTPVKTMVKRLLDQCGEGGRNDIRAVVSTAPVSFLHLYEQSREILECQNDLFFGTPGMCMDLEERAEYTNTSVSESFAWKSELLQAVLNGEERHAVEVLEHCLSMYMASEKEVCLYSAYSLYLYLKDALKKRPYVDNKAAASVPVLSEPDILHSKSYISMKEEFEEYVKHCCRLYQNGQDDIANWVRRYVAVHYSESCTIEEMAEGVHLSPNYLRRKFKEATGQTILEYLTDVRLTAAGELLKKRELKVKEISVQVGYENISYFTQLFSKKYGVTPNEYKKMV